MHDRPAASGWPPALAGLLVLWLVTLVLFGHTLGSMVSTWSSSDTYAHGFVVPLISIWLIWRMRGELARLSPRPSFLSVLFLLVAALVWLAGDLVAVNTLTQLALMAMIMFAVPTTLGWKVTRQVAFPLGFLLFAVPFGDFLLPRLMDWTADFTVLALRWTGIPVYREGLQFVIPSGTWSVVEACSGIRYLIASVTVGSLFAYLSYRSLRKRILFVGVSILVPLVANWLRAYMIVMIGHLSGNELATGVDHLIYGWVFFGIVILSMLMIGARWADVMESDDQRHAKVGSSLFPVAPHLQTVRVLTGTLMAVIVISLPAVFYAFLDQGPRTGPVLLSPPTFSAPWSLAAKPPADWQPDFRNPAAAATWAAVNPEGAVVGLHVSYYRNQNYDRKLVSSVNSLVSSTHARWSQTSGGRAAADLEGQTLVVVEAQLRQQGAALTSETNRLLVWRFYWVNGHFTASDIEAKLRGAIQRIAGQGDDGAIIALFTPLASQSDDDPARALAASRARLNAFTRSQWPQLQSALQQAADQE